MSRWKTECSPQSGRTYLCSVMPPADFLGEYQDYVWIVERVGMRWRGGEKVVAWKEIEIGNDSRDDNPSGWSQGQCPVDVGYYLVTVETEECYEVQIREFSEGEFIDLGKGKVVSWRSLDTHYLVDYNHFIEIASEAGYKTTGFKEIVLKEYSCDGVSITLLPSVCCHGIRTKCHSNIWSWEIGLEQDDANMEHISGEDFEEMVKLWNLIHKGAK